MQSCVTCIGAQSDVDVEHVSHVTEKQNDLVASFLIPSATGFFLSAFFFYYYKKISSNIYGLDLFCLHFAEIAEKRNKRNKRRRLNHSLILLWVGDHLE